MAAPKPRAAASTEAQCRSFASIGHASLLTGSVDPLFALIVVQVSTLAVAICAWALSAGTGLVSGVAPDWWDALAAMATGAIYYGVAYLLFLFGLRQIEAGKAGMFLNLVPVFTILLALAVLGERLSSVQWIGSLVVVVAVTLAGWMNRVPAKASRPS